MSRAPIVPAAAAFRFPGPTLLPWPDGALRFAAAAATAAATALATATTAATTATAVATVATAVATVAMPFPCRIVSSVTTR